MKKILWISDYSFTGYTLVTQCLLGHIRDNYEVFLLVINVDQERDTIIKRVNKDLGLDKDHIFSVDKVMGKLDNFNFNILTGIFDIPNILKEVDPDLIFSLNDYQILTTQIKCINSCSFWKGITVAYMPIDAENYPEHFFKELHYYDHVITMNNASKKVLLESKFYSHIYVLNHPIKETFFEIKDKSSLRNMFGDKINANSILIFNANTNSDRKRLDLTIESFYMLYKKYTDNIQIQTKNVFLVLKTSGRYFDIEGIINTLDIKYDIILKENIIFVTNKFSYEDLNRFYNCADLYITTTSGEGWGLTAFEFLKLNIYTLVPSSISYIEFFNQELLCDTCLTPLREGRTLEKPYGNVEWCILKGYKSGEFSITRNGSISIKVDSPHIQKYIISPNTNFPSFNSVINNLRELSNSNMFPNKFMIFLEVNDTNKYTFYNKIMTELYNYDLNNLKLFAQRYNIQCVNPTEIDSLIVQVKIPILDDLVNKMIYYITNKEQCDEDVKVYSANILKDLSNEKIGEVFKNILQDIIME
tara:strand:+ start:1150 stop:2739 length:1590 start_codon:yes stop_codon:yes gene_type:complete